MSEVSASATRVGDYDLRVVEAGLGRPVVVLGDLFGVADTREFCAALAQKNAVQAPVHPGFDGTPQPEWLDTIADLANFYLEFLKARGLRAVNLVGLGVGGWIAAELAVRDASRLASLTLVNAAGIRVEGAPQCDVFLGAEDDLLRRLVHDPSLAHKLIETSLTPEREDLRLLNQQYAARLCWQPRLFDPHLRKWLHRIDAPTLLVWGEKNALFPQAYGAAWRDLIPGAQLETLAACGHLAGIEKPAELSALVTAFIAQQGAAQ